MKFFTCWQGKRRRQNRKFAAFSSFVHKEFLHIFRDMWTTLILLLLPVLMTVLFGFGITTEIKNGKVAVLDPSKDVATQGIVDKLATSEYFTIAYRVNTEQEIDDLFKQSKIGMAIVFNEKFYENMLHTGQAQILLLADATDPNTASMLNTYAGMLIASYQMELSKNLGTTPLQITPELRLLYNPTMKGSYSTAPGVLGLVLILICAMMTSVAIVKEKQMGTMEVLLVSPLRPITIILAKTIPYFVLSLVNLTSILLLSYFLLEVPFVGSFLLLIAVCLLYIFVALAFGILISTLVNSQLVAMLISGMVLMLPVIMLSGLLFPVNNMPLVLQWFSCVVPARWFITAIKSVMIKGAGFDAIIKEFLILLGMAVVLLGVSIKKFKNRLE
ncbi:ABC transporter permease [Bacteroidales bacterium OttesenSCG-928-B11]|nr:ABC transporter permease [Bacteroidales bacterium OttesenSCG-928-C03]MDL2311439.1 ABC transporter permease [Bacteroidales bacterium OttesenSCG-928-B11]